MQSGKVIAVSKSAAHSFSKKNTASITLIKGMGVEGDAHAGKTVQHLSRIAKDPDQPNLRQVHLIHSELFEELQQKGFIINPGEMGENITTSGLNILELPKGTVLVFGDQAAIEITGLRNPCAQLDGIQKGLMKAVLDKDEEGNLIRKAGIMAVVIQGGTINTGDKITVLLPEQPYIKLDKV